MSAHTQDIKKDHRVSLTITAKDFKGAADGRVVLIGSVSELSKDKIAEYRELYMKKHSDAYWIDFGDFSYFTMSGIDNIRYVGGFARAGGIMGIEYLQAKPDPIAAFAEPVMKHMNEDHSDSTIQMIKHYIGLPVKEAEIISLDRLGMTVKAKIDLSAGGYSKIRLPWPRPVSERKAVKEVLVEMTKASSK
jgi:putative heme iron utilization protein